jgi:hypothetical protein
MQYVSHGPRLPTLCHTLTAPIGSLELAGSIGSAVITTLLTLSPVAGILAGGISLLASRVDRFAIALLRNDALTGFFNCFDVFAPIAKLVVKSIVVLTLANFVLAAIAPFIGIAIEIDILFGVLVSLLINGAKALSGHIDPLQSRPEGRPYLIFFAG